MVIWLVRCLQLMEAFLNALLLGIALCLASLTSFMLAWSKAAALAAGANGRIGPGGGPRVQVGVSHACPAPVDKREDGDEPVP